MIYVCSLESSLRRFLQLHWSGTATLSLLAGGRLAYQMNLIFAKRNKRSRKNNNLRRNVEYLHKVEQMDLMAFCKLVCNAIKQLKWKDRDVAFNDMMTWRLSCVDSKETFQFKPHFNIVSTSEGAFVVLLHEVLQLPDNLY